MIFSQKSCFILIPLLTLASLSAEAVSVESLADQLSAGEAPVLIDVRSSSAYQAGHIPNAINLPFSVMESRALPPLGEVIIYGDGLGRIDMEEARARMESKPNISCQVLAGGYAAWQTRSGVTTAEKGLQRDQPAVITYEDLMKNEGEGLVIYDLRKKAPAASGALPASTGGEDDSLEEKLPRARIASGSPLALLKRKAASDRQGARPASAGEGTEAGQGNNPLLRSGVLNTDELIVLIDDDHKTANELARKLRAGGFQRVAVLAGGDLILKFEGRSGLSRQSAPSPFKATITTVDEGEEEVP